MRNKAVWGALCVAWLLAAPARAQITIPNTFTALTTADPDQVNANFTQVGNLALNRSGGTMTGTLTSQGLTPSADASYDLGPDITHRYRNAFFSGTVTVGTLAGTSVTAPINTTTGAFSGTVTANLFSGSGASLTSLVPTQLTGAGRIPMAAAYYPTFASKSTTYSASATTDDDLDCDASGGGFTITLPTPVGNTGKTFNVKKTDSSANTCTVATAAGTIDGASTFAIVVQNQNMTFRSNGSNYEIR